ncbi:MAG: YkvA family protein [Caldiserica bacterium]|nr:YkvA family protein [Caldisericota bacterium]
MSLRIAVQRIRREVRVWSLVLKDPRTPQVSKWLLGAALVYLASPVDLVPDFVPVLGQLDDLLIVPGLVWLATRFVPRGAVAECRERAYDHQENGLPSIAVDP